MGRLLGAHDADELDRPDLNKCPDCGCYFATDDCPLCGRICPEEMRAGNRKKVKQKKRRSGGYAGRVQFIPWYHTWWFIAIMLWWMFPIGVVLFFTSPYSRKAKIIVTAVAAVLVVAFYGGMYLLMSGFFDEPLVNDDIPRAEYVALCQPSEVDAFHRDVYDVGAYTTMELTVTDRVEDIYSGEVHYICTDTDSSLSVILIDCILEERQSYRPGDFIRVWGESAGVLEVSASNGDIIRLPGLYMAYCDLIG